MPVTQRWVHSGLVLVAGILSISLTVLILGASRPKVSTSGLVGSQAPVFALRDTTDEWVKLKDLRSKTVVLIAAQSQMAGLGKQTKQVQQLVDTFGHDSDVKFIGLQFDPQAGLLTKKNEAGVIETNLPSLQVAEDIDGSVAQAYRVGATPVLFVIDGSGIIRARLPLDSDGATIVASETITSLREVPLSIPVTAGDHSKGY